MTMTLSKKHSPIARAEGPAAITDVELQAHERNNEFEALFQEYWERLCRVLYAILGDWADAEDLVLEAFVQLHRRPPPARQNMGGWLYRVATNLGLNALRARQRRIRYETQAGAIALFDDAPEDPAVTVESALERQRVRDVLAKLKPRSTQLLILRHSGLSYAEIAEALELSPASIGALLARAEKEFEQQYRRL